MADIKTYNSMSEAEKMEYHRVGKGWPQWVLNNSKAKNYDKFKKIYKIGRLENGNWAIIKKSNGQSTGFESNMEKPIQTLWLDMVLNWDR